MIIIHSMSLLLILLVIVNQPTSLHQSHLYQVCNLYFKTTNYLSCCLDPVNVQYNACVSIDNTIMIRFEVDITKVLIHVI